MKSDEIKVTGRILTISNATKARNPEIFGTATSVRLCPEKPECDERCKSEDSGMAASTSGVCYRVTFIVRRPRLLDSGDNDRTGLKSGRDFITGLLGFASDDDPRIEWLYHQIKDRARSTTVIIETT